MVSVVAAGIANRGGSYLPLDTFELEIDPGPIGRSWYEPGDYVTGRLQMSSYDVFHCLGVQVSLEGIATVSYRSADAIRSRTESLLPFDWASVFFIGTRTNNKPIEVQQSTFLFPFRILIKKLNPFPGTFKASNGEIVYKVAAYVNMKAVTTRKRVQQVITVKSYLNLLSIPTANIPVFVECYQYKPLFFKKTRLKCSLSLYQRGFLPGEIIHFLLHLNIPYGKSVNRLGIALIRKISFMSEVSTKSSSVVLQSQENSEYLVSSGGDVVWESALTVPNDAHPTTKGLIIRHQYLLRIIVNTDERNEPTLKRDVPVIIGSLRAIESGEPGAPLVRARSRSMVSISSNDAFVRIPPNYSQLTTKAPSLETLPPMYDDAVCHVIKVESREVQHAPSAPSLLVDM